MMRFSCTQIYVRNYSRKANNLKSRYDVVCSGGGLVGAAAACAIASDPLLKASSILVIEPKVPKVWTSPPERFSNRVYSIAPGTKKLLEELSVWPTVVSLRHRPVRKMQIWEAASDALIIFDNTESRGVVEDVSYIVEDEVLSSALWKRIRELSDQIDVVHDVRADSYRLPSRKTKLSHHESLSDTETDPIVGLVPGDSEDVGVTLSDGTKIDAALLIGADGPSSPVRHAMGIQYFSWNYEQKAIVATMHLSEPQDNSVAWQRFSSLGPIALLPLDEKRSSLVWSTSSSEANRLLHLTEELFLDELNRAIWDDQTKNFSANAALRSLDGVMQYFGLTGDTFLQMPPTLTGMDIGSRAAFPLGLGHATQYVIPGVALIGDAAHRIHPLAGLGVNLGFQDVACLRRNLRDAVGCGEEINSLTHLLRYESESQRLVVPIMTAIDSLNRLYSSSSTPVVVLRSLGLNLVNSCTPLKRQIMKFASQ